MSDGSLQVDPTALAQGAIDLRGHHFRLQEAVTTLRAEYAGLQENWTGAAADHIASVWDELHPRLTTHIGTLNTHATALTTAANAYLAQDTEFSDSIAARTSSLDLP